MQHAESSSKEVALVQGIEHFLSSFQNTSIPVLIEQPTKPQVPVALAVASTGVFAVTFVSLAFMSANFITIIPALFAVFIFSALWFMGSLMVAVFWREWKWNRMLEKSEQKAKQELGEAFDRWRVYAVELEHTVKLQLVRYRPKHKTGENPVYYAEIVEQKEFEPSQEIEALNLLADWKEQAAEKETEAFQKYCMKRELLDTANNMVEHKLLSEKF